MVISIDGFDARFLNDPSLHVKIPNIRALARKGASASVVGIGSPAFDLLADERGLKVANVFFPGNSFAWSFPEMAGNQFDEIAQKSRPAGAIEKIETMFPSFEKQLWDDSSSAQAANWILATGAPDLLVVHLTDVESEQKTTGALSVFAREALENDDDLIGQILSKTPKDAVIAIVSNHGAENANYVVRPAVLLQAPVEVEEGLIGTSDPALAERIRKLMTDHKRHGISREVPMTDVRARYPKLSRWVAAFDTLPNYMPSPEEKGPALGPGTHLAVWNLWPERPQFRSVFVIAGDGVQSNKKLGEIDIRDIGPTLANAIGSKLPDAKAKSLWPSLRKD
ncbi:MAG TPA: alkaline phosphatase family protein [Bryobacteraceae bacterium]|nr:alkaline phosphatase family protein [Bryobacteraceae bacterium]